MNETIRITKVMATTHKYSCLLDETKTSRYGTQTSYTHAHSHAHSHQAISLTELCRAEELSCECVCVRRMCMIAYPCYNIFTFLCYYFVLGRKSNASTPTVKPRLSKNICFYSTSLSHSLTLCIACLPVCLLSMLTIHFAHNLYLSYRFRYTHYAHSHTK